MACDITLGRLEPCKNAVGGLTAAYFVNFGDATGYTFDVTNTDVIVSVSGSPTAYKYDLRGTNSLDQTITSSRENGTTFFDQSLKLQLKNLTPAMHKQVKLLSYGRPQVIVQDNNLNLFLCGLEHGMEVTGGTIVTGAQMGDLSGYTLEFKGMERLPANFLAETLEDVGFTIVSGT
jgi:hypothetical protein